MATSGIRAQAILLTLVLALSGCGSTLQGQGGAGVTVDAPIGATAPIEESVETGSTLSLSTGTSPSTTTANTASGPTGSSVAGGSTATSGTAPTTASSGSSGPAAPVGSTVTGEPAAQDDTAGNGDASAAGDGGSTGTTTPEPATAGGAASTEPVKIGVVVGDAAALYAVFGVDGEYDPYAIYEAFKDYFNERGGLLGRPIELSYEVIDVSEDYNQAGQRVCEAFTQDNPMDLIFDTTAGQGGIAPMHACFAQHDIALFGPARWTRDDNPTTSVNFFSLDGIRVDRYAGAYIDLAVAAGLMGEGDVLGVLYEDCPWGRRTYNDVSRPTAARHGIATVEATVKCVENLVADLGPVTNQARSAALRFQSEFVTHVMVLSAAEGFIVGQFSRSAEDQLYRPNYLITTNQFPYNQSAPDSQIGFHANQKPQAAGFGWIPLQDVGDEAAPVNQTQAQAQAVCAEVDPTLGQATSHEEGSQDHFQFKNNFFTICDAWFGLRATVEANGADLSYRTLRRAWPGAVASLPSAVNASGSYQVEAAGFDAIGAVRPFTFNAADGRFSYSGPPVAIP